MGRSKLVAAASALGIPMPECEALALTREPVIRYQWLIFKTAEWRCAQDVSRVSAKRRSEVRRDVALPLSPNHLLHARSGVRMERFRFRKQTELVGNPFWEILRDLARDACLQRPGSSSFPHRFNLP